MLHPTLIVARTKDQQLQAILEQAWLLTVIRVRQIREHLQQGQQGR